MGYWRLFMVLSLITTPAFAVTKAKIKRGNSEISIDLSQPSTKSQIKDFDVIMLEEGTYATLGDFTAKYVRVRGQGPGKTIITNKVATPILVDSTEFWDLTISDAQFKVNDLNGLWAVNVEFTGKVFVKPAAMDKSPAFAIRTVFSDISKSEVYMNDEILFSHFLTKKGDEYLMPLPGDYKKLKDSAANLLAYEDQFDRTEDINLKNRIGYKGLFARGLNYLYQKEVLKPHYDHSKYNQLIKNARSTKAVGHLYVSMLYWAEADRLSGHSQFDEVLKEITPLSKSLSQDCGCTVEGQGLAKNVKSEIEQKLYAKLPITGLPGNCKIQTMGVVVPAGMKKEAVIAAARLQNQNDQMVAYQSIGTDGDEETLLGAEAPSAPKDYTAVADVSMPGLKKSFHTDVKLANEKKAIDQNVANPIIKTFMQKFAANLKAAKARIASTDVAIKIDGYIAHALYGDEIREKEYEDLHEQQFGRKSSAAGAMSSAFAY